MKRLLYTLCLVGLTGSLLASEVSSQWLRENRARRWDASAQVLNFAPKDNALNALANQTLRARVTTDFRAFVAAAKKGVVQTPKVPWFFDLDANLAHQDENLISVWYERFERRLPDSAKRSIWVTNFAMMAGKPQQVTLTELSGGLPDALRTRILDMVNLERDLNGGAPTEWLPSFNQNVVLTKSSLVILLMPQEIASSQDKVHKLYIPLTEAAEMSAEDSPIRRLRGS